MGFSRRKVCDHVAGPATLNGVEDFTEMVDVSAAQFRPAGLERWRRMHFAARAHWADSRFIVSAEGSTPHAHSPEDCAQIENWVTSTLEYVISELSKAYR